MDDCDDNEDDDDENDTDTDDEYTSDQSKFKINACDKDHITIIIEMRFYF